MNSIVVIMFTLAFGLSIFPGTPPKYLAPWIYCTRRRYQLTIRQTPYHTSEFLALSITMWLYPGRPLKLTTRWGSLRADDFRHSPLLSKERISFTGVNWFSYGKSFLSYYIFFFAESFTSASPANNSICSSLINFFRKHFHRFFMRNFFFPLFFLKYST